MLVELIAHTNDPERTVAAAAKLCYSDAHIDMLLEGLTPEKTAAFLQKLSDVGHASPIEHASFTFGIEGVSRTFLAQVTRHRIGSFSVQSQRYVSYEKGFGYIVPPKIAALGPEAEAEFKAQMEQMHAWYTGWQEKLGTGEGGNEDARFVLPGACETRLMVTMNTRELRHFFNLRMCERAQWEIRAMATEMHRLVMEVAPALFKDAGAPCISGPCPEGEKCCGKMLQKRQEREAMLNALADRENKEP